MMISVLIMTYNEERNIQECIGSLPWTGDVHVVDSFSTDKTVELAEEMGAKVVRHEFSGYASQRNFGISLPFEGEWIVMLDADERMTEPLAREIEAAVSSSTPDEALFQVRRKDIFMGRWLRRASGYPTWFARVLRKGRVTVQREVNEIYVPQGRVRNLREHLVHLPFNKGIDWWFDRHNAYSTQEALLLFDQESQGSHFPRYTGISRQAYRRALLKAVAYRLPFRPFIFLLYLLIWRGGILDGRAGVQFAYMRMAYEIMIDSKLAYFHSGASHRVR